MCNLISDKGLVSRICKETQNSIVGRQTTIQVENGKKNVEKTFYCRVSIGGR